MKENLDNKTLQILEAAVENANDAFVTIDEKHKVVFFNHAAEKIFGYQREEVISRDLNEIMSPSCSKNHREAVARYVRTRIPKLIHHVSQINAVRKNGETFPAEISFSVSELEGSLYFTGIVRDLSETKALQEQIQKSERLAALGRFVAEITHEIKRPLMMIGSYARQLLKETWDEKNESKLNTVVEEVSRLEDLILELREFYQQRPLELRKFDVNCLLQNVVSLVGFECEKKQINLNFSPHKDPVIIEGDWEKLKQVFLNIINNSIEAVEARGNLLIQIEKSGQFANVKITDNGRGIPDNYKREIFSPFFTTKKHGTGLGLCISKGIIEKHKDSTMTVESREGEGTTVKVNLPLQVRD